MKLTFYKYQGTGNDFVMIDNREGVFDKSNIELIQKMCDRKFGIGADGLILIENMNDLDFNMVYFNSDGSQSFCGNGSRCAVAFAKFLGIIHSQAYFNSTDGEHEAWINANGEVSLKMHDVAAIEKGDGYYFINTGSPHYIEEVKNVKEINVYEKGKEVRYNDRFKAEGTNVNFVKYNQEEIDIRTYERGVEDETLSCGTGVTAAALSWADKFKLTSGKVKVNSQGGELSVAFKRNENGFNDIWLIGPATFVFKGEYKV
ncbi:MAG: diaminopimelate epimerase [Flavobacteriales bacterium]|nr:diaminopimelate epimerase [Flavobacteriales bacterium]MCB9336416.1 diaminopimelate epimerase [Flavobacteriales bacterium]